jgi:serine/threonine protein phosphatase PrpC
MGAADGRQTPRVATASFPGPNHIAKGVVRQDAACAKSEPRRAVIAVADGHGASKYTYAHWGSTLGAQIACDVLWEFTAPPESDEQFQNRSPNDEDVRRLVSRIAYLWRQRTSQLSILFERWDAGSSMTSKSAQAWVIPRIDELRNPLTFEARELAISLAAKELSALPEGASEAFGTTLLAAAIWGHHLLLLRMGDGAIIVAPASGDPFAWEAKNEGKAFSNRTASLSGSAAGFEWELHRLGAHESEGNASSSLPRHIDPRFIVLVTDGVSDPYVPKDIENARLGRAAESARVLGSQIRPRAESQTWQEWCAEITGFLVSLSRASGDDATLAALDLTGIECWWVEPGGEVASETLSEASTPPNVSADSGATGAMDDPEQALGVGSPEESDGWPSAAAAGAGARPASTPHPLSHVVVSSQDVAGAPSMLDSLKRLADKYLGNGETPK